eukprot:TRINITY_DN12427_c0_g1_i16.p2 TRINITY_DN12427_c0_g1~~TRINITY_DN12427_c0_g1_i16.p2  ORF type:complete len:281 (-),score=4.60 TRINITY_DN12427_c0_g1_i16:47-889(-)
MKHNYQQRCYESVLMLCSLYRRQQKKTQQRKKRFGKIQWLTLAKRNQKIKKFSGLHWQNGTKNCNNSSHQTWRFLKRLSQNCQLKSQNRTKKSNNFSHKIQKFLKYSRKNCQLKLVQWNQKFQQFQPQNLEIQDFQTDTKICQTTRKSRNRRHQKTLDIQKFQLVIFQDEIQNKIWKPRYFTQQFDDKLQKLYGLHIFVITTTYDTTIQTCNNFASLTFYVLTTHDQKKVINSQQIHNTIIFIKKFFSFQQNNYIINKIQHIKPAQINFYLIQIFSSIFT